MGNALCGGGAFETIATEPDDHERWCFSCRHRHLHTWELRGEVGLSWYEPLWNLRCPCCKQDHTAFPSRAL